LKKKHGLLLFFHLSLMQKNRLRIHQHRRYYKAIKICHYGIQSALQLET